MRSSWQIQQAVIKALLGRELKTRFGGFKLGYAWVLMEPLAQILVLVVVFSAISRAGFQGVDFALFFAAAILPFNLFSTIFSGGSNAVQANQGLFTYRQVKPFDAFFTRLILEVAITIVTFFVLLMLYAWWGFD
ncbi:MAG: ABC transporter permease, partial [Pseudomonadales bacterium]|nr:ABC transporter permease [Pseudomonadales bacterium]